MSEFRFEPLSKQHDRQSFCCGVAALDDWLKRRSMQDQDRHVAAVYVMAPVDEPTRIAGFYTLSAASVLLSDFPPEFARKLPRYQSVPAILLGRLARDSCFPGLGKTLLWNALQRAWNHSLGVAAAAVVVDAKDDHALDFYLRHGFAPLTNTPQRLFLPIKMVERTIA